jgi:hypothetical protein
MNKLMRKNHEHQQGELLPMVKFREIIRLRPSNSNRAIWPAKGQLFHLRYLGNFERIA